MIYLMLVVLTTLQIADLITTIRGLEHGLIEKNRIIRWILKKSNNKTTVFTIIKVIAIGFFNFTLVWMWEYSEHILVCVIMWILYLLLLIVNIVAVKNNIRNINSILALKAIKRR